MRTFFIILLLLASSVPVIAQPTVVASIRPLQLIAMAVVNGISTPGLVMEGSQDPHHPSLKPSQRRIMDQADIFLWVGPQLETGMERVAGELDASILTAIDMPGLTLRFIANQVDPHIWLDTRNAAIVAAALAAELVRLDTENAEIYLANLTAFQQSLAGLDVEISRILDAQTFPSYAVYHNSYQYFEKQFGLSHVTSFTGNEEIQPGIRQVLAIKSVLLESGADCIVVNPSVNTGFLDNQLESDNMHYTIIDILANDVALASDAYAGLMYHLTSGFVSCRQ